MLLEKEKLHLSNIKRAQSKCVSCEFVLIRNGVNVRIDYIKNAKAFRDVRSKTLITILRKKEKYFWLLEKVLRTERPCTFT